MDEDTPKCLVCGSSSNEVPLLSLRYQDQQYWICPQDFPTLIHEPQQLVGKLPGVEKLHGHEH